MNIKFSVKGLWVSAIQAVIFLVLTLGTSLFLGGMTKWLVPVFWLSSWSLSLIFFEGEERFSFLNALLINAIVAILFFDAAPEKGILLLISSLAIPLLHFGIKKMRNSTIAYVAGPALILYITYMADLLI